MVVGGGRMNLRELRERRDEILAIAARHGATNVRVFGSVARGEAATASDIDFLVDMLPQHSSWWPAGLILDLEETLGRGVDVATPNVLRGGVRENVLREAIPL